jgi:hypothetical protein
MLTNSRVFVTDHTGKTSWQFPGLFLRTQVFTASGTFTPESGVSYVIMEVWGSGGHGGQGGSSIGGTMNHSVGGSGGGGGSGSYFRQSVPSATFTITFNANDIIITSSLMGNNQVFSGSNGINASATNAGGAGGAGGGIPVCSIVGDDILLLSGNPGQDGQSGPDINYLFGCTGGDGGSIWNNSGGSGGLGGYGNLSVGGRGLPGLNGLVGGGGGGGGGLENTLLGGSGGTGGIGCVIFTYQRA